MRTLLTHAYYLSTDEKEQAIMRPYPPLGILCIGAYLQEQGLDVEIFDTTFSTPAYFREHLLATRPDVVGIYTNLMTKLNVLDTIGFIRNHPELGATRIVLGGPEVTHHADRFLEHGADVIVVGEGEETLAELVANWSSPLPLSLANVHGIVYRGDDGSATWTPERALIKEIDRLPMPKRDAIDIDHYQRVWREHHGQSAISISTMRGCPYSCRWCSRAVYGESYRRRSPRRVVDELEQLRDRWRPDTLWFVDDVFTINHRWLEEFAREVNERGVKIPYECITRADRLNERAIDLLKESGCFRVWIGAESGSQKILDAMDRRVTVEQVREMIQLAKRKGIEAGTFIMLGYPGETEEDIEATIEHLKRSDPDHYTVTVAYPITGTPLHEEVKKIITVAPEWSASTDRDVDFERTYSRRYYDYAMRRIFGEVELHRIRSRYGSFNISALKQQARVLSAKMGMRRERRRTEDGERRTEEKTGTTRLL